MGPVYCMVILTVDFEIMTFILKYCPGHCWETKWLVLHNIRTSTRHGTCALLDHFVSIVLTLTIMSNPLLSLDTIHANCFICPGHINLTCNLCSVWLIIVTIWLVTLILWASPWQIFLSHCYETIHDNCSIFSGHSNLTWDLCTVE